jgi:Holliday junction resolvasome RuvABC endonuclease subunit
MPPIHSPRVLALAPGTRHLGFAVVEDKELIHFGVKTLEWKKTSPLLFAEVARYLTRLFPVHRPTVLAIEDVFYAQAKRSRLLRAFISAARRWARQKGLRVLAFRPTSVKEKFCEGKRTRMALAEAMVRRYWFLYSFLKAGRTRPYWLQMFDAVALGTLVAADSARKERQARSRVSVR